MIEERLEEFTWFEVHIDTAGTAHGQSGTVLGTVAVMAEAEAEAGEEGE